MSALLIIAHRPLASALCAVAKHVYPDCGARLQPLDVDADASIDTVEAEARRLLSETGQTQALILTDVFGATPCNAAQRLADGKSVRLVTGVNVPMLWRALCYREESIEVLAARAVAGGGQGVMQVATYRPQNQPVHSVFDDPVNAHHQQ